MAPLVGPTWPILTTSASAGGAAGAGAAAVGAGVAAGAAASSFLPQATSVRAARATAVHFNCMGTSRTWISRKYENRSFDPGVNTQQVSRRRCAAPSRLRPGAQFSPRIMGAESWSRPWVFRKLPGQRFDSPTHAKRLRFRCADRGSSCRVAAARQLTRRRSGAPPATGRCAAARDAAIALRAGRRRPPNSCGMRGSVATGLRRLVAIRSGRGRRQARRFGRPAQPGRRGDFDHRRQRGHETRRRALDAGHQFALPP